MPLDNFLNNIAYLYLTDRDFQKISDLAGIHWSSLPDFECVKIMKKYFVLLASNTHQQAIMELSSDLAYLEMCNLSLQRVGKDEDEISHQFKKYYKQFQYHRLGEQLLAKPEQGEKILSEFDVTRLNSVSTKSVSEFLPEKYESFLKKQKENTERVIIPQFKQLSELIGGFNFGRVIMVLGETGFGKTNFAINLLVRAATKYKCLFINMEMPLEDITNRLVVLTSQMTFKNLYAGEISTQKATEHLAAYGDNLKFTDGFSLSLQTIEALMRKEKANGLDFVVIDYDQKIDLPYSKHTPEWKSIQDAIQRIENLSKEIQVCVLFMAQVNRDGNVSASHRATFTAHTILNFKSNDAQTVYDVRANALISAEKNRHGKKNRACLVSYNDENLNINEITVIDYKKPDHGGRGGEKRL
jgi:RecA/RadA recombinase